MLHTLSRSPYQFDLETLLRCMARDDVLVLFQDGVLAARAAGGITERLLAAGAPLYALRDDVDARGLAEQISPNVTLIDYTQFVRLTAQYAPQLAW